MTFGCVVLTRGDRPEFLAAALASLQRQRDVELDIVVVGNGWDPTGLPPGVRGHFEPEDRGIPAGRNAGVPHVTGDLLFFLDDDAVLVEDDALAFVGNTLGVRPLSEGGRGLVGLAQLRVEPSEGEAYSRDWVPRLRVGDRREASDVTVVWEGAVAIRRDVFEQVGGWPEEFRFVHEGVDLAWRVLDAGYRVRYAAERSVTHPPRGPAAERHGYSVRYAARNRVFLARRNLPLPLGILFVASFALRTLPGLRTRELRAAALDGYRAGLRESCGPRRRLRARTLWAMTRAGRPPVL
ncbi:MAG: glycosyltransferase family 2 protein [Solirubrobacteraceae bacterium]